MNRQRSTSERFMEPPKLQGKGCQNRLHVEDTSGAHENVSTLRSVEVKECGGVVQEEYDRLLGKICEEISHGDIWLTFPEGGRDAVEITSNDMESVQPGGFLSDNVIDFYIKYLCEGLSCYMHKDHLHLFNSFFFTQLADKCNASTDSEQRKTAFEKVQKWTGGVNIFEKAYVFIPVNQSYHWSLIIICHLSSLTSSPDQQDRPPCILHLDSVEGKHGNLERHIRSYIIHAWKERYHDPSVDQLLALSQMKYAEVKVPQQNNHYDCGIYLLHFVELFLVESLVGFDSLPNQGSLFSALWDASEVSAKRRDIRNVILELSLASRRKSQRHQKLISRLSRLIPFSQISAVLETRLDGNGGHLEEPQNNDRKQSNVGAYESEYADHQTAGEVALDSQQHTEMEHVSHQSTGEIVLDDQQQLACAKSNPIKERNKRYRNWSEDETSVLLDCKIEGGRFWKKRKQGSTDWIAISQEIENKLGTSPSGDQCRLRYDTLLKAYKSARDYCMRTGKQFSEELCLGELKLATNLTEDWYNAMDKICCCSPQKERSPKRMKFSPSVDGGAPVSTSSPTFTCAVENVTKCAEARPVSQSPEDRRVERVDVETAESPTTYRCSQQRALEYLREYVYSISKGPQKAYCENVAFYL